MVQISGVVKRDGRAAAWDGAKVTGAVARALAETGEGNLEDAAFVARSVESELRRAAEVARVAEFAPGVESVQDAAERQLMLHGFVATAKAYILYRQRRAEQRRSLRLVPAEARALAEANRQYFPNALGEFVYYRTYSRWLEEAGRREVWSETVGRYVGYMRERLGGALREEEYLEARDAILRMEVMPSMRLLWSAGAAARACNVAAYNCAYVAPAAPRDFGEILYVLACGAGVGFSAEGRNVQRLPVVERQRGGRADLHVVGDSKEGWADALVYGLEHWYDGGDVEFDFREVRPEGARLRTMGGRASGPGPIKDLLAYARRAVLSRQGRRLETIGVHDLVCKIGDVIQPGGVRRSAEIGLSDLDDERIRDAKRGHFFLTHAHRRLANNSAVYEERPGSAEFMREWLALAESGSGERGIFNRGSLLGQVPERRAARWAEMGAARFEPDGAGGEGRLLAQVGTNPCGEIYLLSKQFCNLTEAVCRPGDTPESLRRKVRVASMLGTYQSTLTDFRYLGEEWRGNCERERLLGVSLTGQWDCEAVMERGGELEALRRAAVRANREYAERLGVGQSTAVTCGKPSGTLSQLVDSASGGHPRYAPYYVRRVRVAAIDPLFRMLRDQGVPHEPENGQLAATADTFVFSFPCRAPDGARTAGGVRALDQLAHWLRLKREFTEHNPSVTIYVGPDEWVPVGAWVWEHWDEVGGLAFLPREDHVYRQAPYEEITAERYAEMAAAQRPVDYSLVAAYEADDETQGSKELACAGGGCEL